MTEPISLKEIIAIVVKRGRGILCFAVAVALIAGGWQAARLKAQGNDPQQQEEAYQEALAAYEQDRELLEKELELVQQQLERKREYCEKSLVFQLNPYHVPKTTTIFAITSDGWNQAASKTDYAFVIRAIQNYYQLCWTGANLADMLKQELADSILAEDLQELMQLSIAEGGALKLEVYGRTQEEAEAFTKAACNAIASLQEKVAQKTYDHKIVILSQKAETVTQESLIDYQQQATDDIQAYEDAIQQIQQQLAQLSAPVRVSGESVRTIAVSAAKWAILGGVVAAFLSCAWVLALSLLRSTVESSRQMERVLGVTFLGSVAQQKTFWNWLGGRIMGERQWKDPAAKEAYLTENLKAMLRPSEDVAVISTLTDAKAAAAMEKIHAAAEAAGKTVCCVAAAETNAQAIAAMGRCKQLILAERAGVSNVAKMRSVLDKAKQLDVEIVGFVTI